MKQLLDGGERVREDARQTSWRWVSFDSIGQTGSPPLKSNVLVEETSAPAVPLAVA